MNNSLSDYKKTIFDDVIGFKQMNHIYNCNYFYFK